MKLETPRARPVRRTAAVINKIHSARDLDALLVGMRDELRDLFDVEQLIVYSVDRENRELYSRHLPNFVEGIQEIRLPICDDSLTGLAARTGNTLIVDDAYDEDELDQIRPGTRYETQYDRWTGMRTRQVLVAPMLFNNKYLMGVLVLTNRRTDEPFGPRQVEFAEEIAETLAIALYNRVQATSAKRARPKAKFDTLVENGVLTRKELDDAIIEARRRKQPIERFLIDALYVPSAEIGASLAAFYECEFVAFDKHRRIDPTLLKGINTDYLQANHWVPLGREDDVVHVLLDNPNDIQKVEAIKLMLGGAIHLCVGLRKDILRYILAGLGEDAALDTVQGLLGELSLVADVESELEDSISEEDGVIVRLVNQIMIDAHKLGASDIHIEPNSSRKETVVRMRIDGVCQDHLKVPATHRRALISRIKIMAALNIAERRRPQDGKIRFRLPSGKELELRVAIIPTAAGDEDAVLRLLTSAKPLPLDKLELAPRNVESLNKILARKHGLALVVGPTGSGKTTTLHAALASINEPERKIWTAEDPVEISQPGLRQLQVNPRVDMTFAAALRAFLRADPDVIMVGEMRDQETAQIAVEASLTGHLVLSTLHTNSAVETVTRLIDMGIARINFADALLGVLAQRLVRRLCPSCRVQEELTPEDCAKLRATYGEDAWERLGFGEQLPAQPYRAEGCPECRKGYRGRLAIHELLMRDEQLARAIISGASTGELREIAFANGMSSLAEDGLQKVLFGLTDLAQIRAAAL